MLVWLTYKTVQNVLSKPSHLFDTLHLSLLLPIWMSPSPAKNSFTALVERLVIMCRWVWPWRKLVCTDCESIMIFLLPRGERRALAFRQQAKLQHYACQSVPQSANRIISTCIWNVLISGQLGAYCHSHSKLHPFICISAAFRLVDTRTQTVVILKHSLLPSWMRQSQTQKALLQPDLGACILLVLTLPVIVPCIGCHPCSGCSEAISPVTVVQSLGPTYRNAIGLEWVKSSASLSMWDDFSHYRPPESDLYRDPSRQRPSAL